MAVLKRKNGEPCSPFILISEKLYNIIFSKINERISKELEGITRPLIESLISESKKQVIESNFILEENNDQDPLVFPAHHNEIIPCTLMLLDITVWKKRYALVHAHISLPLEGYSVYHYFFYKELMKRISFHNTVKLGDIFTIPGLHIKITLEGNDVPKEIKIPLEKRNGKGQRCFVFSYESKETMVR